MKSTPVQYDTMAGDIYGFHTYESKHNGDDKPPTYTVTYEAMPAKVVKDRKGHPHKVAATPARNVVYTGEQAKAAFLAKHGFVYEGDGSS